jgi:hypothetical protein
MITRQHSGNYVIDLLDCEIQLEVFHQRICSPKNPLEKFHTSINKLIMISIRKKIDLIRSINQANALPFFPSRSKWNWQIICKVQSFFSAFGPLYPT